MKVITSLFLTLVLLSSCGSAMSKEMQESTITYQALSRGFYLKVDIQGNKMTVVREQQSAGIESVLNDSQLKDFEKLFKELNLEAIKDYKAPTEKRFYDGAAIATLQINYQGKIYDSQAFDHGNPPVEIADFINKIVLFTEN